MLRFIPRDRRRQFTHAICLALTFLGWGVTIWLAPDLRWYHSLADATAYLSLGFMVFTLAYGPFKLLVQKRNPVNLMLRRDVGIWAGVTGLIHVVAGLQVHMGGDMVLYFFARDHHHNLKWLTNLFGISNDIGLAATVVLILLLLLSNDLSLRLLRGPLWKWLQRANYLLLALVVAHGIGYQIVVERAPVLMGLVVALTLLVVGIQIGGVLIHASKNPSTNRSAP